MPPIRKLLLLLAEELAHLRDRRPLAFRRAGRARRQTTLADGFPHTLQRSQGSLPHNALLVRPE